MMGNEIESYLCMLSYTDYMINLLFHNKKDIEELPDVFEAVEIMENFERFNSIDEIKKVDNVHIQRAIKELENKKVEEFSKTVETEKSINEKK